MTQILKNISFENVKVLNQNFIKHYHETYTLGINYQGIFKSVSQNETIHFYKYSTRINNPTEIHSGISQQWSHTNFYPTIELMSGIYEEIYFEKKIPFFNKHIIEDKTLFDKLHLFFTSYYKNDLNIKTETLLLDALSYLIITHSSDKKEIDENFFTASIVKQTYEYINDCIDVNFSLDVLAKNANLSKYHFLRSFKKEFGQTPHAFITNTRINKAKELIISGDSISHASLKVGFNDQSHFTRNFKKIYGYTPKNLK